MRPADIAVGALAVVLLVAPVALFKGAGWRGSDQLAAEAAAPGMARTLWAPPSPEIETGLFTLQAALGAGVLGYVAGYRKGSVKGPR